MLDIQALMEGFRSNFIEKDRWKYLVDGLAISIQVTLVALLIGLILGSLIALIRVAVKDRKPGWKTPAGFFLNLVNKLAGAFITLIRGTPSTLQLLTAYAIILKSIDQKIVVAMLTFGINSSAYIAEIMRGGIQSVPVGEIEAARSLGLSYMQAMRRIVLPQAVRIALPSLGNEVITLFKETSICGFIGLMDLTRGSNVIISQTYNAAWPYAAATLIYLLVVKGLEVVFRRWEARVTYA